MNKISLLIIFLLISGSFVNMKVGTDMLVSMNVIEKITDSENKIIANCHTKIKDKNNELSTEENKNHDCVDCLSCVVISGITVSFDFIIKDKTIILQGFLNKKTIEISSYFFKPPRKLS